MVRTWLRRVSIRLNYSFSRLFGRFWAGWPEAGSVTTPRLGLLRLQSCWPTTVLLPGDWDLLTMGSGLRSSAGLRVRRHLPKVCSGTRNKLWTVHPTIELAGQCHGLQLLAQSLSKIYAWGSHRRSKKVSAVVPTKEMAYLTIMTAMVTIIPTSPSRSIPWDI